MRPTGPVFTVAFVPAQIARLRSELDVVRGNTKVMSEMLTEMVPGQEEPSDLELLQVPTPLSPRPSPPPPLPCPKHC